MSTPDPATDPEGSESPEDTAAQQALAEAAQEAGDDADDDNDDGTFDQARARRKIEKANREARNLREEIKKLRPLAQEAEKRRQGEMTEAQKLTEAKAALEAELAELRTANVRREAAEAAGLPSRFVKFITAAEASDALAQAKELAKELKAAEPEPQPRKADLRQGARGPNGAGSSMSPDDLLRQMAGRQ